MRESYDIVSRDPRGIGESSPLSCPAGAGAEFAELGVPGSVGDRVRGERVAGRAVAAAGRQLNGLVPTIRRQPATWPSPDELLDGLRAGQCEPGGASGGEVTSPAVNCLDLPDRRTPAQVMAHSERAAGVVCVEWPAAPAYRPHRITAAGPAPILVVGTTHDTAAPCDWAVSAAGC